MSAKEGVAVEDRASGGGRPTVLESLGYGARSQAWRGVRVLARAVRPYVSAERFDRLYGLGRVGYLPDVRNPKTLVEKLLWLKRNFHHPDMPRLSDKLAVREYVRTVAPDLRVPEVYAESASVEAFPFDRLPTHAVLKPTHTSGHVAFWEPGVDREQLRARLAKWLALRYDQHLDEWFYGAIAPRVFAERDLRDPRGRVPADYKVLVLNGDVAAVQVFEGRGHRPVRTMFDRNWTHMPVARSRQPGGPPIHVPEALVPRRPACLDALIGASERLAAPFPFVRVDLYVIEDEPYFGEMTFMPAGGYLPLVPRRFDHELGARLQLPPPLVRAQW